MILRSYNSLYMKDILMKIKNNLLIIVFCTFISLAKAYVPFAEPLYMCSVLFPSHYTAKPEVPARFKGHKFTIKNGSCQLPQGTGDIFYIVITEEVSRSKQKSGNLPLKRLAGAPCTSYRIMRNSATRCGPNQAPWFIEEIPLEEQSELLPEEALIFLVNPAYIKEIKIVEDLCNHAKYIPALVVDPEIKEADFQASVITSELASVDTNILHKPVAVSKRWHNNSSATLVT